MRLCLNRVTLAENTSPALFLRAAHAAGFGLVEMSARRLAEALQADDGVRDLLGPGGVVPIHGGWSIRSHWQEAAFRAALPIVAREMEFVAALGSRSGALVLPRPDLGGPAAPGRTVLVDRIRRVCDLAADRGLNVVVEFIGLHPHRLTDAALGDQAPCRTLADALDIVARVERPNAGILIDTFHWHASGATPADLAQVPAEMPLVVHLNDAPPIPAAALDDSQRLLPGHGVIDLMGLLGALHARGYTGPLSIELKNPHLHAMAPVRAAEYAWKAAMTVLRRAGLT
ncbi:sugar phosphate isomerase/epimerase (plasmid) [Streptosporangium sp. NBC_01495]|uniref:sugar phosphate isomerase/epimerase family protein n=1 Tax=Streptosporangium sp. NBC_01495 TaxID=2903899 RepID=UPI002E37801B|nr:sugar phosphate isomerase/epimerase family protein [Streptosporangium sp. NBC_01495]